MKNMNFQSNRPLSDQTFSRFNPRPERVCVVSSVLFVFLWSFISSSSSISLFKSSSLIYSRPMLSKEFKLSVIISSVSYHMNLFLILTWAITSNRYSSLPSSPSLSLYHSSRWSWMSVWCAQSRVSSSVVSSAKTRACTSAVPENTASPRPWPASAWRSCRGRHWANSSHATTRSTPTGSKTGQREVTGPIFLAAPTARAGLWLRSASLGRGLRISCSWLVRPTCHTWRSTARGCGVTTSWGGNTRACWRNTGRRRRAPGRPGTRATPGSATGHRGISALGRSNGARDGGWEEDGWEGKERNTEMGLKQERD